MAGRQNGKVAPAVAAKAVEGIVQPFPVRHYRMTTDSLTPKDMKRARVALGGRNPWELTENVDDRLTLIMWCLKSRHIPGFTWEDAENTPYGEFLPPEDDSPPPIPASESSGRSETTPVGNDSSETPPSTTPEPSSASSST